MRNTIGIVTGKDFFGRDAVLNRLYRRLNDGNNIFMAAPRRVGKTCIMHQLMRYPREHFVFVYVFTQDIHNEEDFYKKLLEEVFKSEAVGKLAKNLSAFEKLLSDISSLIGGIELWGGKVELKEKKTNYRNAFEKLLTQLNTGENTIVIMVDEFPDTLANIAKAHGNTAAIELLQSCRSHRHNATRNIRFIYTGSIGLPVVVKQFTGDHIIADLDVVYIPPFSEKEATEFMQILFKAYNVPHEPEAIDYLLSKIQWLIPFHLKLAFNEIVDVYEQTERPINTKDIDRVFTQMLRQRNNMYLDHYHERLIKSPLSLNLLSVLAQTNTMTLKEMMDAVASMEAYSDLEFRRSIEILVFDGYIFDNSQGKYQFTSMLLKMWWVKYVCKS